MAAHTVGYWSLLESVVDWHPNEICGRFRAPVSTAVDSQAREHAGPITASIPPFLASSSSSLDSRSRANEPALRFTSLCDTEAALSLADRASRTSLSYTNCTSLMVADFNMPWTFARAFSVALIVSLSDELAKIDKSGQSQSESSGKSMPIRITSVSAQRPTAERYVSPCIYKTRYSSKQEPI